MIKLPYFGNPAFALLAIVTLHAVTSTSLEAGTITVGNLNDSGAGSLRQAIQDAASGDRIEFALTGTITLTSGELLISKNLSLIGPGAPGLSLSGNTNGRVLEIASKATVTLSDLTIRDGHAPDRAGATGSVGNGGGILNVGALTLIRCTVSGNTAGNWTFSKVVTLPGTGGAGGGIYNLGTLSLITCTLSGNAAGQGGNGLGVPGGNGGGGGAVFNAGDATLTACTVSGNRAGGGGPSPVHEGAGGNGGGILNAGNASFARVRNTLVAVNSAGAGGHGNNFGSGNGSPGTGPNLYGAFTSEGHNLVGLPTGSTGFVSGVKSDLVGPPLDPMLGPLQSNGGPTLTMALLPGSPALNAGDDALLSPPFTLSTDQRGLPRKLGSHVDIGAFEFQAVIVASQLPGPPASAPSAVPRAAFCFTVVAEPGTTGTIEASTDLRTWSPLKDFVTTSEGTCELLDPSSPTLPTRFYRVMAPR